MLAYVNFPTWLKPEIIPGLPIRWYGLMYIIAFAVAFLLFNYQAKKGEIKTNEDLTFGFFISAILGLIIGARILGVTLYQPGGYYITHPWFIFWPFDANWNFTGYQGLSYHGGLIGLIVGTMIFCKRKKLNWLEWGDALAVAVPLGYTFGRLGNFINGELWGRITTSGLGMVFPDAPEFYIGESWVREFVTKIGMGISEITRMVNLPRHPSQLYEAFFEGIVLWLILWFIFRKRKAFHGALISLYLMGYGLVRFFVEYTREPDGNMGFPIELVDTGGETARFISFLNFSTGQILCFLMIMAGLGLYLFLWARAKKNGGLIK